MKYNIVMFSVFFMSLQIVGMNFGVDSEGALNLLGFGGHLEQRARGWLDQPTSITSFSQASKRSPWIKKRSDIIFLDLDGTLIRTKYPLHGVETSIQAQYLNYAWENYWYLNRVGPQYMQSFADHLGVIQAHDQSLNEVLFVEALAKKFIEKRALEGAIIIGLTARPCASAFITRQSLLSLGIDFAKLSHLGLYTHVFPSSTLIDGICYTERLENKAQQIIPITQLVSQQFQLPGPFFVSVFDDSRVEIEAIDNYPFGQDDFYGQIYITPYQYQAFDRSKALIHEYFLPWSKQQSANITQ